MKRVMSILSALFLVASPFVLYWCLTHHSVEIAAYTLLGWVLLRTIPVVLAASSAQRKAALQLPAIALAFTLFGLISKNPTWLLVLPSATQATFGLAFFRSLSSTPLIEHFARMVKPNLDEGEIQHCRTWTRIWGVYVIVLAAIGLCLAEWASLEVWTIYVGVVSYVLVGVLFAVEHVVRKIQFRDYSRNPLDWLLSKMFPARSSA